MWDISSTLRVMEQQHFFKVKAGLPDSPRVRFRFQSSAGVGEANIASSAVLLVSYQDTLAHWVILNLGHLIRKLYTSSIAAYLPKPSSRERCCRSPGYVETDLNPTHLGGNCLQPLV